MATTHAPSQGGQALSACSPSVLLPVVPFLEAYTSSSSLAAGDMSPEHNLNKVSYINRPPCCPSAAEQGCRRGLAPLKRDWGRPQPQSQWGAEQPHADPLWTGTKRAPAPLLPNPPSFPCLRTPCRWAAVSREQHATGLSASLGSLCLPALQSKGLFNKALGGRAAARWFRRRVIGETKHKLGSRLH